MLILHFLLSVRLFLMIGGLSQHRIGGGALSAAKKCSWSATE